jgi:hypothetical protein
VSRESSHVGWAGDDTPPCGVSEGGHAEVDGRSASGHEVFELGEFGICRGQADLESLGLAAPTFLFGFGDAGDQVVADVDEAGTLGWVGP